MLVGVFSANGIIVHTFQIIFNTSPSMLRRLWTKDWPGIVINFGISWAYAVVALSIKPDYVHGLWLLFFKVSTPIFFYAMDAIVVYGYLRMHPKALEKRIPEEKSTRTVSGTEKAGKKKNSWTQVFFGFIFFLHIVTDVARHYLIVELSKDVNLITLNIINPFTNRAVTFNNVDLATALFWTATIFMAQTVWATLTKKAMRETTTDMTNYKFVLETSADEEE